MRYSSSLYTHFRLIIALTVFILSNKEGQDSPINGFPTQCSHGMLVHLNLQIGEDAGPYTHIAVETASHYMSFISGLLRNLF